MLNDNPASRYSIDVCWTLELAFDQESPYTRYLARVRKGVNNGMVSPYLRIPCPPEVQIFQLKENLQRHFMHLENQPGGKQYCLHCVHISWYSVDVNCRIAVGTPLVVVEFHPYSQRRLKRMAIFLV